MAVWVAAIDANLLVPIVACDFLLTAFEHGLFEPIVSSTVLDEVERNLLEDFPHVDPDGLRKRVSHMRAALADQIIDSVASAGVVETINPKDRHVVAAALASEASVLVTADGALRAEIGRSELGLEPLDGDTFAVRLWEASPADVDAVVLSMVTKRRRRTVSPVEMVEQLREHFPSFAAAWLDRARREARRPPGPPG